MDYIDENNHSEGIKNNFKGMFMIYLLLVILITAAFISSYIVSCVSIEKSSNKNLKSTTLPIKIHQLEDNLLGIPKVTESDKKFALSNKIINIAILGLDERNEIYDGEWSRADSIMILTIDERRQKIKLSSILRDCYVDVEEYGIVTKDKINHSFAYGASEEYERSANSNKAYHAGAMRSVETLNDNFKMNIKDYVVLNFKSFQNIIERLGGVEINMTEDEVDEVNEAMGDYIVYGDFDKIPQGVGVKLLNGKQALAYARNRNIGGDQDRAMRQRIVIQAVYKKMKLVNPLQLTIIIKDLIGMIKTNLSTIQVLNFSSKILFNNMTFVNSKFPSDGNWYGDMIDYISYDVISNEELNIIQMREFIYNDILPKSEFYEETTTAPQE